jgi:hypothetical protein
MYYVIDFFKFDFDFFKFPGLLLAERVTRHDSDITAWDFPDVIQIDCWYLIAKLFEFLRAHLLPPSPVKENGVDTTIHIWNTRNLK